MRFLTILLLLCLVAVAALVVAPSFIDWNAYRGELAALLSRATGRQVAIDGALEMALLPSPHLNARNVRIADGQSGEPELAQVGEIRMQVEVAPLFTGRISISSLLLVEPVINLATTPEGRGNWEAAGPDGRRLFGTGDGAGIPLQLTFDQISVANGTLNWRRADGRIDRLEKLNTQIAPADDSGPTELEASATYRGRPFSIVLSLAPRRTDGLQPFRARIVLAEAPGTLSLSGVADLEAGAVEGRMNVAGPDAAAFTAALTTKSLGDLPVWAFEIESEVTITAEALNAPDLSMRLGEVNASGIAALKLGDVPSVTAELDIASLNIDELSKRSETEKGNAEPEVNAAGEPARLPNDFEADLRVKAGLLRWKDGIVRDADITARLEGGELAIDRAAAQLPGGTTLSLSGKAVDSDKGIRLYGDLAAISDNLRAALVWAGLDETVLPADRLRAFSYTSRIAVNSDSINLNDIKARFDATRASGAAVIARRKRPSFGVSLQLDRLSLDAYFDDRNEGEKSAVTGGKSDDRQKSVLEDFDANLDLSVADLAWKDRSMSGVRLDSQLFKGELMVRDFTIADFGGAALDMSGKLRNLGGDTLGEFDLSLKGEKPESFAKFLGSGINKFARRVGPFEFTGRATGDLSRTELDAVLFAAGGETKAVGTISDLRGEPSFDLVVNLSNPDADRLIALVMPDRRGGGAGALDARMHVTGAAEKLKLADISGKLGRTDLEGQMDIDLSGQRTYIDAELDAGEIMLDELMAESPETAADDAGTARGSARWSRERFDVSGLRDFDMGLKLNAEALVKRDLRVENAVLEANLRDGIATVDLFSGNMFGGTVEASGRLQAAGETPAFETVIAARNVSSKAALEAASDFARFKGPVSIDLDLSGGGGNEFELVSSLAGTGSLSGNVEARLKDEERAQAGVGTVLGMVFGDKVRELGAASDAIATLIRAFAVEPAALSGDFTIERGAVRTENLLLDGSGAKAVTTGTADLANWTIASDTVMYRQQSPEDPYITLGLKGPLDAPNVRTGGAWLRKPQQEVPEPAPVKPVEPAGEPESGQEKPPDADDFVNDILESIQ